MQNCYPAVFIYTLNYSANIVPSMQPVFRVLTVFNVFTVFAVLTVWTVLTMLLGPRIYPLQLVPRSACPLVRLQRARPRIVSRKAGSARAVEFVRAQFSHGAPECRPAVPEETCLVSLPVLPLFLQYTWAKYECHFKLQVKWTPCLWRIVWPNRSRVVVQQVPIVLVRHPDHIHHLVLVRPQLRELTVGKLET